MKKTYLTALCAGILAASCVAGSASAHGVFFANRLDQKALVLGEGPGDNAYEPSCVTKVEAYDKNFSSMDIETMTYKDHVAVVPDDHLGVTVTFFDYGYFTKDAAGTTHEAMFSQVADAVKTTHAIKWNVHYWSDEVMPGGIYNVPIQIVPSVNPLTLRKGDTYQIRVYKNGQPYAHAPLIKDVINDLTNESTTDENGYATVTVSANGLNVVGVEVAGDKEDEHTTQKYFSSLSFIIDPE